MCIARVCVRVSISWFTITMVLVLLPGAVSALQSSAATGVCLRQPRSPVYYWQRVSRTVAASIEDEEDLATREVRRRSRLLGDNGPDAEVSGFDELFASLREEEERAVAEAEAEAMSAFLTEIDGDLLDELPPPRRESRSRSSELPRGAGGRQQRRGGGGGTDGGFSGGSRSARRAMPLYNPANANPLSARTAFGQQPFPPPVPSASAQFSPTSSTTSASRGDPRAATWQNAGANGLEAASVGGQLNVLVPTKVMVFIDGTWLYYQLFGRGRKCSISRQYGERWWETHHIDFSRLPQLISDHLSAELARTQPYAQRAVEVVRVLVFSSLRPDDEDVVSQRERMFRAMQELHFEVHLGEFTGGQEKCVDIALAVDMMHYATVPNAFDIGVLISGDRDFIPALVRTRQKGKRVAVCSMRNSASTDYEDPEANIKDFGVLWLDDHLDDLVVPIPPSLLNERPTMARYLRTAVGDFLEATRLGEATLDELSQHLDAMALGENGSALSYIEDEFDGLLPFLGLYPDAIRLERRGEGAAARLVAVAVGSPSRAAALAAKEADQATSEEAASARWSRGTQRDQPPEEREAAAADAAADADADADAEAQARAPTSSFDDEIERILAGVGDEAATAAEAAAAEAALMAAEASSGGGGAAAPAAPASAEPADSAADNRVSTSERSGRSDGALIVDGSLIELLEADVFVTESNDILTVADLAHLTVPQLKVELRNRGRPTTGTKPSLLRALVEAIKEDEQTQ